MLLGNLRGQLWHNYPDFFSAHQSELPACLRLPPRHVSSQPDASVKTQQSFGYEWTKFSTMRPEWERNYWGYLAPKTADFLRDKVVLDAGCGMARHLYFSAQHCAEAIGIDFSVAVDVAARDTAALPHAHVVQADLNQLPFRPQTFDFIYSLGVLHHVPDPDAALRNLLQFLKPGGEVRVYVYWNLEGAPTWKRALLAAVNACRRVTVRLPHGLLLWLCYPIALGSWLTFVLPSRWLSRTAAGSGWVKNLPLRQYGAYPFGVLLNDTFDRFSAPIEQRFSPHEVRAWLERAGLDLVTVSAHWGWLGHGRKTTRTGSV
jgi:SAM-dependent methyltransferase